MRYATNCASPLNAPSPGRTNSSACCCALRPNRFVIWDSNSLPSHSSISGSFAEAETCNQFVTKDERTIWTLIVIGIHVALNAVLNINEFSQVQLRTIKKVDITPNEAEVGAALIVGKA